MATHLSKRRREQPRATAEGLAEMENAILADADVYETEDKLILRLDVPGVEKGRTQIEVDENHNLQVRARNSFQEPKGAVYKEFEVADYYRSFRLGEEFDKEKISAQLDRGVLEIVLPKREEVKPRRIAISA